MPCFSFSAPTISLEEEFREREELGTEYQQIQDEMHGRAAPSHMSSQDFRCSLEDIQADIANMPASETNHLLQAMEYAPNLVETESNHLLVHHGKRHSHKEVASRLATYWRFRCQLFGAKAYLPVTSLVKDEDLETSTFVKVLQNDRADRPVVFFDRIAVCRSTAPRNAKMRHLFMALHMLCEEEKARKSGFVFIENISGFDLYTDFDRILTKTKMTLLRDCFPIQLKCYHLCGGIGEKWVVDMIVPVLKQMAKKNIRLRMVCHTASPHNNAATLDVDYMILPSTLPLGINGRRRTEPSKRPSAENELKVRSKARDVHITTRRFAHKRLSSGPMIQKTLARELGTQERTRL